MKKNIQISVVISAYNEEKKLRDCLESVAWADEIIVVDNQSSDKTKDIGRKYTEYVYSRENNLMLNVNKNYGFTKATGTWILCLDADERVTKELAEEIKNVINGKSETDGFWIPRKNIIFDKWMQYTGWYPDYQLRLFKNGKGKFPEQHVHETIAIEGESGHLKESMVHYNFETIAQFLHKHVTIYAPNEAAELIRKGYVFDYLDAIRFPTKEFLSRFFAREGYKDGFHGLMLSLFMAFYHLIIFSFLWEHNKFIDEDNKDMLHSTSEELKRTKKEFIYWIMHEKTKNAKNPVHKLLNRFNKHFN